MKKRVVVVKRAKAFEPADNPPPHAVMPARPHTVMPAPRKVRRNGTRKKTVYLPDDLCRALRVHCAHEDASETEVVIAALMRHLGVT